MPLQAVMKKVATSGAEDVALAVRVAGGRDGVADAFWNLATNVDAAWEANFPFEKRDIDQRKRSGRVAQSGSSVVMPC